MSRDKTLKIDVGQNTHFQEQGRVANDMRILHFLHFQLFPNFQWMNEIFRSKKFFLSAAQKLADFRTKRIQFGVDDYDDWITNQAKIIWNSCFLIHSSLPHLAVSDSIKCLCKINYSEPFCQLHSKWNLRTKVHFDILSFALRKLLFTLFKKF